MKRMRRLHYGLHCIGILIINLFLGIAAEGIPSTNGAIIMMLLFLSLGIYQIIITIKRLHDINTSGWYSLFTIIPFVWLIFLFIPGTKGPNRFGDDPKEIK